MTTMTTWRGRQAAPHDGLRARVGKERAIRRLREKQVYSGSPSQLQAAPYHWLLLVLMDSFSET
jgi:hypothetical protein